MLLTRRHIPFVIMPSQKYLQTLFNYDSTTGQLVHKYDKAKNILAGSVAGTVNSSGYVVCHVHGKKLKAHRIIWVLVIGAIPKGFFIDHIDHDRSNNRISNLRLVSAHDNQFNRSKSQKNTSGVTGVHWHPRMGKWCAQIKINRKTIWLGAFDEIGKATYARIAAEHQYGFHPNHGI